MYIKIITLLFYLLSYQLLADLRIIQNGFIIKSKPYSDSEATLIVSNSDKIYICSVVNDLSKCILSSKNNKDY